ncbi:MAG: VPLPA-CTERM sorting domain-containing protein [Planctomycetota bacterium]
MMRPAAAVGIAAVAGTATADVVDLIIFEVIATNDLTGASQTRTYTVDASANAGDTIEWTLPDQLDFADIGGVASASVMVTTDGASRGASGAQSVVADFSVFASTQNASFQINSAVVSFSTIQASDALGFASAAVTLVDVLNDGAALTPAPGGGYQALVNGGSTFASLFPAGSPLSVPSGTGTLDFNSDTGAFLPAGVDVSSISASWNFSLSGFDSATGTSTFTVIPAPASAAMLGLGGLAAARRRR